ncbi:MAG: DUF4199 domain-containing protein [Flavobacteriales bacterium TMED96]|nr:MAG: DUF4199 domain-containing protein [Flavobacteriales bacterium TMED96]RPG57497.1 MAG: DUF4199 domain-containing protein [Flavobacteriales bacterium TMED96]|tara:strand:- start:8276 stop:8797 length:522 start_codon:yes stop_codon:yes gene_type:complete
MFTKTRKSIRDFILHYGNILGLVSVVFALMIFFLDLHYAQENSINLVNYGISVSVIIIALLDYRKTSAGILSLGDSIKMGMGIFLISAIYISIYTVILINFLDTETLTKSLEVTEMKILEQNPEISEEQLDQILSFQEKFSTPFVIITVLIIFSLISGFFSSLILGLIFKKSR